MLIYQNRLAENTYICQYVVHFTLIMWYYGFSLWADTLKLNIPFLIGQSLTEQLHTYMQKIWSIRGQKPYLVCAVHRTTPDILAVAKIWLKDRGTSIHFAAAKDILDDPKNQRRGISALL